MPFFFLLFIKALLRERQAPRGLGYRALSVTDTPSLVTDTPSLVTDTPSRPQAKVAENIRNDK